QGDRGSRDRRHEGGHGPGQEGSAIEHHLAPFWIATDAGEAPYRPRQPNHTTVQGRIGAGRSFKTSGRPAVIKMTRSARSAIRMLSRPWASRKARPSGVSGTMPSPTSLLTNTTGTASV